VEVLLVSMSESKIQEANQQHDVKTATNSQNKIMPAKNCENEYKKDAEVLSDVTDAKDLVGFCNVKYLRFQDTFNCKLEPKSLPSSLIELQFGEWYNHSFDNDVLPSNLKTLRFGGFGRVLYTDEITFDERKQKVEGFDKPFRVDVLPSSLIEIHFGNWFNQPLGIGVLPSNLRKLEFGNCFNWMLKPGELPFSLTELYFGYGFNKSLDKDVLSPKLTVLCFGYMFNKPFSVGTLPPNLTKLHFSGFFNQPLSVGTLPSSLTELHFGKWFNQPLDDVLPCSDKLITERILPFNLTNLRVGSDYTHQLFSDGFPNKTFTVQFGECDIIQTIYHALPNESIMFNIDKCFKFKTFNNSEKQTYCTITNAKCNRVVYISPYNCNMKNLLVIM
jgi:hypothetical protein